MIVEIRTRGFTVTAGIRTHVERRLAFALDRHAEEVARARIVLADVNGPRGGADKACRIEVTLRGGGRAVRASAKDGDAYAAIDLAAHRVARGVARELERQRTTLLQLLWLTRTMARRQHRPA